MFSFPQQAREFRIHIRMIYSEHKRASKSIKKHCERLNFLIIERPCMTSCMWRPIISNFYNCEHEKWLKLAALSRTANRNLLHNFTATTCFSRPTLVKFLAYESQKVPFFSLFFQLEKCIQQVPSFVFILCEKEGEQQEHTRARTIYRKLLFDDGP
jgi:hypothetical protein